MKPAKLCLQCKQPIPRGENYSKKVYCTLPCFHASRANDPVGRFWAKVEKRGPDECWPWIGRKDKSGYGRFDRKGPNVYAHRIAYRLTYGPVPDGMDVLHTCDHRDCCNPLHYFLGTHQDNMNDCKAKRRTTWGERSAKAVLTEAEAREILRVYRRVRGGRKGGWSNARELAAKYGVKPSTITAVVAGRSWAHLHPEPRGDHDGRG